MTSTAISIKADREYVRNLAILAKTNGVTVATLVRCALDITCGENLETIGFFITQNCAGMHNNENESTPESKQ